MKLLEMYFWMIIIISGFLNLLIITATEDLKGEKRFKKYLKISFFIGLLGILMVSTGWNYLCGYVCLVFTYSPFITLLTCKSVMIISNTIFNKEGFQINREELTDGFFQENEGDLKYSYYYKRYSLFITITPIIVLMILLIILQETTCYN